MYHTGLSQRWTSLYYPSKKSGKDTLSAMKSQFASICEFRLGKEPRDTWSLRVVGAAFLNVDPGLPWPAEQSAVSVGMRGQPCEQDLGPQ